MIVRACAVIFACLAAGQALVAWLHLPLPASVIGLILLFALLFVGWVKLADVQALADVLLKNLTLLFIPPCVALMNYFDLIVPALLPMLAAIMLSTLVVLLVTGAVHQWIRRRL